MIVAAMTRSWTRRWITNPCRTLGSQLGSASVIVIDDTVNMDWLVNKTVHFFKHESCGKCTPCREGTYWMTHLDRAHRTAARRRRSDIDLLHNVAKQIRANACAPWANSPPWPCRPASSSSAADFEASNRRLKQSKQSYGEWLNMVT